MKIKTIEELARKEEVGYLELNDLIHRKFNFNGLNVVKEEVCGNGYLFFYKAKNDKVKCEKLVELMFKGEGYILIKNNNRYIANIIENDLNEEIYKHPKGKHPMYY